MPLNYAVVGLTGKRQQKLHVDNSPEEHSLYSSADGNDYVTVECLTLPEIFDSHQIDTCDFLKMDCEGAEYEILLSCPEEYLSRVKRFQVEFHEEPGIYHNRQDLIDALRRAGFDVAVEAWDPNRGYIYGERTGRPIQDA